MADIIFPGQVPESTLGSTKLPANMDLVIWQGDAQTYVISLTDENNAPLDLSNCTASAVIRSNFTDPTEYSFNVTISGNNVTIYLSSAVCKNIPAGNYVWSFQISKNGDWRTYLVGDVTVYPEVPIP